MSYDVIKKDTIRELLKVALDQNEFIDYVCCMPNLSVSTRDANGKFRPNIHYTMYAIYDYYNNNPASNINKKLFDALMYISDNYKGETAIYNVLQIISYQLERERLGIAPFSLDCKSILNNLRKSIINNKSMYMEAKEEWNNVPFWDYLENYNNSFDRNYGLKFL